MLAACLLRCVSLGLLPVHQRAPTERTSWLVVISVSQTSRIVSHTYYTVDLSLVDAVWHVLGLLVSLYVYPPDRHGLPSKRRRTHQHHTELMQMKKGQDRLQLFLHDLLSDSVVANHISKMFRKSLRKSSTLGWLKRLLSSSSQLNIPPSVLQELTEATTLQVQKFPDHGRGLVAAKNLAYGEVVLTERPFVCCPAISNRSKVCYHCLKVLPSQHGPSSAEQSMPVRTRSHTFCSTSCLSEAHNSYYSLESQLPLLQQLDQYCTTHGERFPLIATRLALMIAQSSMSDGATGQSANDMVRTSVSSKASSMGRSSRGLGSSSWRSNNSSKLGEDVLSRASSTAYSSKGASSCQYPIDAALGFLCFANVPPPPPAPWVQAHQLLWTALQSAVDFREQQEEAERLEGAVEHLDVDWYCAVMARLHLNTFKVDGVIGIDWDSGHAAAAALLQADSSTGSALYLLGSLFNHSCEPNVNVTFPGNDSTVVFTAARPIAAGEQLLISYIDSEQEVDRRQEYLQFAYGFKCRCQRCLEELAEAAKHVPPQLH